MEYQFKKTKPVYSNGDNIDAWKLTLCDEGREIIEPDGIGLIHTPAKDISAILELPKERECSGYFYVITLKTHPGKALDQYRHAGFINAGTMESAIEKAKDITLKLLKECLLREAAHYMKMLELVNS